VDPGDANDAGSPGPDSEEDHRDLPRSERFSPHSGDGLTAGWRVSIVAFFVLEYSLLWA
jgi:hypothetical protein